MDNSTIAEVFKDIKGFEGSYMVSNLGKVKSLDRVNAKGANIKGKLLKTRFNNSGYEQVMLYRGSRKDKNNLFIHRLVAIAFIGDNNGDVNHKDGNKLNNEVANLEWVSKSYNTKHAYANGLMKRCKKVKVTSPNGDEVIMNNPVECSKHFGFSSTWVTGRVKKHGDTFEFEGHTIEVMQSLI